MLDPAEVSAVAGPDLLLGLVRRFQNRWDDPLATRTWTHLVIVKDQLRCQVAGVLYSFPGLRWLRVRADAESGLSAVVLIQRWCSRQTTPETACRIQSRGVCTAEFCL